MPTEKTHRFERRALGAALLLAGALALGLGAPGPAARAQDAAGVVESHALAEYGEPKYGPDFAHFDYADPNAPVGGQITLTGARSSFDSLNTLPIQGEYATNVGLAKVGLMTESQDELSVAYGVLAERVEYPEDRSWLTFTLREDAVWDDGEPVTAEDVAWSFDRGDGPRPGPFLKAFFDDVTGSRCWKRRRQVAIPVRDHASTMQAALIAVATRAGRSNRSTGAEEGGGPRTIAGFDPGAGALGRNRYRIVARATRAARSPTNGRKTGGGCWTLPVFEGQFNFDRDHLRLLKRDRDGGVRGVRGRGEYDFRRNSPSRAQWRPGTFVGHSRRWTNGRIRRREVEGSYRLHGDLGLLPEQAATSCSRDRGRGRR